MVCSQPGRTGKRASGRAMPRNANTSPTKNCSRATKSAGSTSVSMRSRRRSDSGDSTSMPWRANKRPSSAEYSSRPSRAGCGNAAKPAAMARAGMQFIKAGRVTPRRRVATLPVSLEIRQSTTRAADPEPERR